MDMYNGTLAVLDHLFRGMTEQHGFATAGRRSIADPALALHEQGPDVGDTFFLIWTKYH
jgi:hypothetical protein